MLAPAPWAPPRRRPRAADPQLSREVRKELIHALQDGDDPRGDVEDAFAAANSDREREAARLVGLATIGEAATPEFAAALGPTVTRGGQDMMAALRNLETDLGSMDNAEFDQAVANLRTALDLPAP